MGEKSRTRRQKRFQPIDLGRSIMPQTLVLLLTSVLASGYWAAGAPSYELFGAFFPAWLFAGVIGVFGAAAARGVFVASGLSDLIPYQLFVCTAIGIVAACVAWQLVFGW
jgi:hypothetical protein